MGKGNKSKRAAKKTPAAPGLGPKPQLSTVARVTEDPGTPLSTTESPSSSSVTSPGEISPPDTPNPNPATERLEVFEQGITQGLSKSGKGDTEEEELSAIDTTGDDNPLPAHPHTAPSVVSVEYSAALLTAVEREKETEEREAAAERKPYTYDRKIPAAMAQHGSPPLPALDTKGPLPRPMEPRSPSQVRYTFSGQEISSDDNKVAAERARHPWTTDHKREDEAKQEQVPSVETEAKRDYGEGEEEAPTPETEKPTYAEVVKEGQQDAQTDLEGSCEDIGPAVYGTSRFPKTPKNSLAGLDLPANSATTATATTQPESGDQPETRELKPTTLDGGDFGTNIGDRQHQKLAQEEKARRKPSIDLPQHPAVEFTAGPAVPMAKPRSPSIQTPPVKRHSTDLGEGAHPAKMPRRTSADLGMEPVIETTRSVSKDDIMLAHQEEPDTTKEYLDLFEGKHEQGEPSSSLLEGALTSEDDAVYRTDTRDLHQQLRVRDTAIVDLQQTVITLTERIEMLEIEKKKSATTTTMDDSGLSVESEEQVEKFTTISPAPVRGREGDTMFKWGIWAGALIGAATLGGWLGALVERGTVGKQVAEWIWRQARGGYVA
jgi:hypothetical protein